MDISGVGDLKQQIARVDPSKGQPALMAKAEATQVKPSQEQPSQEQLADSVTKMNDFVQNIERNLSFLSTRRQVMMWLRWSIDQPMS